MDLTKKEGKKFLTITLEGHDYFELLFIHRLANEIPDLPVEVESVINEQCSANQIWKRRTDDDSKIDLVIAL